MLPYTGSPTTGTPLTGVCSSSGRIFAADAVTAGPVQVTFELNGLNAPSRGASFPATLPDTLLTSNSFGCVNALRSQPWIRRAIVSRSPLSAVVKLHESYTGSSTLPSPADHEGAAERASATVCPSPERRPASKVGTRHTRYRLLGKRAR